MVNHSPNVDRDIKICVEYLEGTHQAQLARDYNLSSARIGQILLCFGVRDKKIISPYYGWKARKYDKAKVLFKMTGDERLLPNAA